LNFDYAKVETGTVQVRVGASDWKPLTVTEESANSQFLTGRLKTKPGEKVEASYGFGYLSHHEKVKP
jgi:hypothetical protein